MPVDTTGKRQAAAEKLLDKGYLVTVRQRTYTGERRTGHQDHQVYAVLESETPLKTGDGDTEALVELRFTMAALVTNPDGSFGDVLNLKRGDLVSFNGQWVPVFNPGATAPNGDPILYEPLVTNRKAEPPIIIRKPQGAD